jgi:RNA polymerase sigma-B factor
MLEPDFHDYYHAWKANPGPDTAGPLLRAVDQIINTGLRTYGGPSATSPTLRTRAREIVLQAFESYDPTKGSMKSHLMSHLQGLRRYAEQERQIIPVPEQVAMDRYRIEQGGLELEDILGRPPSDQEIADHIGMSRKRMEYVRKAQRPIPEGTLIQPGADGENQGNYMPQVNPQNDDAAAWVELVYTNLVPTDQFILERILGLHGHEPMSPGEIAKLLKLSPGAVSQRMQKIQTQLDKRDEIGML